MDIAILAVVVVLVAALLWRGQRRGGANAEVLAVLRGEFLAFQSTIHAELSTTRQGVEGAKDVLADHAVKTVGQISQMGATVQKLIQQQEEAQRLGQSLKDLLQAPKLRGSYGEAILEELLDRVLPRGIWERQYRIGGKEVVDCIVRFRDVVVPIDAKFPRDDYMRYMEAESNDEKMGHWKSFESAVKLQIASIKNKYIKPHEGTAEFALMFIPSEAIYYETIAERNYLGETSAIWQYAQEHHVVPVSPNVFYAFLQVILLSLQNVAVLKDARKIQEGLAALQYSFENFYKKYEEIGTALDRATKAYGVGDGHIGRFKRRLDSALQLEALQEPEAQHPALDVVTKTANQPEGES